MQHDRYDFDDDDLAEVWRRAQHRRTEDVYSWFTNIFKKRRQLKSSNTRPHYIEVLLLEPILPSRDSTGDSPKDDRIWGGRSGQ
jgi:hypothetical protein